MAVKFIREYATKSYIDAYFPANSCPFDKILKQFLHQQKAVNFRSQTPTLLAHKLFLPAFARKFILISAEKLPISW